MTTTTKTTHFFLRNLDGHRVGVVALRYKAETDKGAGVTVAVSLCHANDPWRSSTGVAAARGRLDANLGWDGRRSNLSYRVDDQVALQDDVFRILTPNGIRKKRDDIDWVRMQALFTKQWTYLTTPPDPSAVKRDPSPRVPTRSGYYWARRKTETPGSSSWSVVRVAEYADGLKIYDEHDIAMDRWEWSARLPAPDEGNKS